MLKKRTPQSSSFITKLILFCDELESFDFFLFEFFSVALLGGGGKFFCFFAFEDFAIFESDFAVEFFEMIDAFKVGINFGDSGDEGRTGGTEGGFFFAALAVELALFFTLAFFLFFAFLFLVFFGLLEEFLTDFFLPDMVDEDLRFGE